MFKKLSSFLLLSSILFCTTVSAVSGKWKCIDTPEYFFLRSSKTFPSSNRYPYDLVSTNDALPDGCEAYITKRSDRRVLQARCPYSAVTSRIMALPPYWLPDGSSFVQSFCYSNGDCYPVDLYLERLCKSCCTFVPDVPDEEEEEECPDLNLRITGTTLPARRGTARISGDWCKSSDCNSGIK